MPKEWLRETGCPAPIVGHRFLPEYLPKKK
jgi:hypothetical protein